MTEYAGFTAWLAERDAHFATHGYTICGNCAQVYCLCGIDPFSSRYDRRTAQNDAIEKLMDAKEPITREDAIARGLVAR